MPLAMNTETLHHLCRYRLGWQPGSLTTRTAFTRSRLLPAPSTRRKAGAAIVHCHVRDPDTGAEPDGVPTCS